MTILSNPLRPTMAEGVWSTDDHRVYAAPYRAPHPLAGRWLVEYHPARYATLLAAHGLLGRAPAVRIEAADFEHAQQIAEQITWATSDGARLSDHHLVRN